MQTRRQVAARLIVASLVILVLFMVLATVAYLKGRAVESDSVQVSTDAVPGSIEAHALRAAISSNIGYAMLASMADTDPAVRARALTVSAEAEQAFKDAVTRYRTTIRINPEKDRRLLEQLQADWAEYQGRCTRYIDLLKTGDRAASNTFFVQAVLPAYEKVIASAEELLGYNHANIETIARGIERNIGTLRWTVVITLGLAVVCVVILVVNIFARLRQMREIEESERRLRLVLDNLFAYVAVLQPDGTTVEVNRAALDAARLDRAQVVGTAFHRLAWWTHSPEVQGRLERALQQAAAGETVRYDTEVVVADGRKVTVDFSCGPLRDSAGRVSLLVAAAVDITARKELEQQFLRAQRMDAIGMLAGGLAHDLNNILAPMLMAAGLLKMRLTEPADQRMVTLIEGGAQRGAGIIKQLLTFSRGVEGAKGPVQFRHLIRDMVHIMNETFPRNIEVANTAPADLWPVVGDATQLHQVLLNLCVNARDAMPHGGRLTVAVENLVVDHSNSHRHPQAAAGRYVLLTTADTGEGIPRGIINRIFDPFFTTKPVGKGTGLGLSTVLGIVKNHGGVVTVDSEPGRGTTFHVYLPAAETAEVAPAESAAEAPGGGETVLLVDDEAAMREATRELLERHNYHVLVASHGEEALQLYVNHRDRVRLVVTDVDMPHMSGVDLIRSLRVLDPDAHILVVSGSSQDNHGGDLAAVGITETLPKPCEPARFLKAVRTALQPVARP